MQGITNTQTSSSGGGSRKVKILNVVQTGTLTRDGTVFSGFSGSNYLRLGARVDNGILSLDSSTYIKYIPFNTLDNWKIKLKIYHKLDSSQSSNAQALFSIGQSWCTVGNNIGLYIESGNSQLARVDVNIDNIYNRILQIEAIYSSINGYIVNVYDENNILLGTGSDSANTKCPDSNFLLCRNGNGNRWLYDDLYIEDCSIEVNNETVWKGVEELEI